MTSIYLTYLYVFNFYSEVYPVTIALAQSISELFWTTPLTVLELEVTLYPSLRWMPYSKWSCPLKGEYFGRGKLLIFRFFRNLCAIVSSRVNCLIGIC